MKRNHYAQLRENTSKVMLVHLVRHAQYYRQPLLDQPVGGLTNLGRMQAAATGAVLRNWPIGQVLTSPLTRTIETTEILLRYTLSSTYTLTPLLEEVTVSSLLEEPGFPGQTLGNRVFDEVLVPLQEDTSRLQTLIVTHGNMIRYLTCRVLDLPTQHLLIMRTNNCAITTFAKGTAESWQLVSYNASSHLLPQLLSED